MFDPRRKNRPVWVRLDVIFRQLVFPTRTWPADPLALDTRGEVPGTLHDWRRMLTGEWLGLVSFTVPYRPPAPDPGLALTDQLVPAEALRPRTYGSTRSR